MKNKIFNRLLMIGSIGFGLTNLIFYPIIHNDDIFSNYDEVYLYLISFIIFIWIYNFFSKKISTKQSAKLTLIFLLIAVTFPIKTYCFQGKDRMISNAAQFNHPTALKLLLINSSQKELDYALEMAKFKNVQELVIYLESRGAKSDK